ncbi:MAG TPA: hypothetical protein DCO89_01350 [Clostridiales bacterium]|nr:hypothetical protein [Clostridiales bacterium]
MFRLSEIQGAIRKYKLFQILNSGENDMFDNKIDRKAVEKCLSDEVKEMETSQEKEQFDLNKTLLDMDESQLFDSIINLKNKNVE